MERVKRIIQSIDVTAVKVSTVVRLVGIVLSIVYAILKYFNVLPPNIDDNIIVNVVIVVFTVIVTLQAYWKNNSWTSAAQKADEYLHEQLGAKDNENVDEE